MSGRRLTWPSRVATADESSQQRRWQIRWRTRVCQLVVGVALCGRVAPAAEQQRPPSPALPRQAVVVATEVSIGDMLLLRGADGTSEYGALFDAWAADWEKVAGQAGLRIVRIGKASGAAASASPSDRDQVRDALRAAAGETSRPLWIVCIGHGTFDGRDAKFNLAGDDLSAAELSEWLIPVTRPVAVIQTASASGPFLEALSAPGRVVITATKSGDEQNFARFGGYLAAAWTSDAADLDKDGQVSLLEAFLSATRATEDFYAADNRLATEHAVLDDNGDGQGTRATAFDGTRPRREADSGATLDGHHASQWVLQPSQEELRLPVDVRRQRDALEVRLLELRDRRGDFSDDEYYRQVEVLVLEIARLYEASYDSTSPAP